MVTENEFIPFDFEAETKSFYASVAAIEKRIAKNGTAMVEKSPGQWTLDLSPDDDSEENRQATDPGLAAETLKLKYE